MSLPVPPPTMLDSLPPHDTVATLADSLPVKLSWLHSEWDSVNSTFKSIVQGAFPGSARELLRTDPGNMTPALKARVDAAFHHLRGKWALWGAARETGRWCRVSASALPLSWVADNVDVLYGEADSALALTNANGIVLWFDPTNTSGLPSKAHPFHDSTRLYKLLEGNHRVSAWRHRGHPAVLPAELFIGEPTLKGF